MSDKKVGVGKLMGQSVKTTMARRLYINLIAWTILTGIAGIGGFGAGYPTVGGICLGIAAVLGICAAVAKNSFKKSVEKYRDVNDRFYKGE